MFIDPDWTAPSRSAYATLTDREGSHYDTPHPPVNAGAGKPKVGYSTFGQVFDPASAFAELGDAADPMLAMLFRLVLGCRFDGGAEIGEVSSFAHG
ncbi:hypothetical protein [Phytomonospora endophytica]|uniref:Uncharacterized protein n=1 Tax=Phytomonospora endophytica TaxID=714109 RepID=A0A841G212_9ACTN|nr:hypothetical protein [Phytomonospora endophytica]MBB6038190.1 hypothetical protein [Phytomonospora endophytica]